MKSADKQINKKCPACKELTKETMALRDKQNGGQHAMSCQ